MCGYTCWTLASAHSRVTGFSVIAMAVYCFKITYLYRKNKTKKNCFTGIVALSAWHNKTDTCANSVDPDETTRRNEPSHQDLQCLPFCF